MRSPHPTKFGRMPSDNVSMLTDLIQKVNALFKTHGREIFLVLLVIITGFMSFGLGRLSLLWPKKEPIRIEPVPQAANATAPDGQVASASSTAASVSGKPNAPATTGNFVTSRNGSVYHFPWCPGAKQIKEENKIWFQTRAEAERAGYKPAGNCPGLAPH